MRFQRYFKHNKHFRNINNYPLNNRPDFKIITNLGGGATANIFLVLDRHNNKQIIKKYHPVIKTSTIFHEHNVLRYLNKFSHIKPFMPNHPELIQTNSGTMYLMYSYINGKMAWSHQMDILESRSEIMLKQYIANILKIINMLHQVNITHLDIKPENLLYCDKNNILSFVDFGVARYVDNKNPYKFENLKTRVGTMQYAAPEIFKKQYCATTDVFSIGKILLYFHENGINLEKHGKELLQNMLEPDPMKRITISESIVSSWFDQIP